MLAHSQYTKREDKVKDKELILFLIRILYFFLVIVQAHKTTIDLFFCCFFLIFLWDLDDNTPRAFLVFFLFPLFQNHLEQPVASFFSNKLSHRVQCQRKFLFIRKSNVCSSKLLKVYYLFII